MRKVPTVAEVLHERSTTESRDEELLLVLFRRLSVDDRSEVLFRLTRRQFAPFFADEFSEVRDAQDSTYLHEELEEKLRLLCPRERLRSVYPTFELGLLFKSLWQNAWGDIAPVVMGSDEQDGQRADELVRAVISCSRAAGGPRDPSFSRMDALRLIEDWREQVLECIFSQRAEGSG